MSSNKIVIGLTGGIGTGKSTAAKYLASRGMIHVDADAISRQLTEKQPGIPNPVLEEIGRAFASDGETDTDHAKAGQSPVLREDGSLDRKAMAEIVFSDPEKKKLLENILFREIIAEIHWQIDTAEEGSRILLDVPLLFESGLDSLCDKIILLTADLDVRIRRVTARDGCTPEEVRARINNQMSDEEKILRSDFVVDNSGTREELQRRLDTVLEI